MKIEEHYEASFPVNAGPCIVGYSVELYDDGTSRRNAGGVVLKYTSTRLGARFGAWWRERFRSGVIA